MSSTLDTPTLDSKLPSLLQRVTEHGGYAFAAMASRAAEGDTRAAEACREMAWEQLQSGPWHSVMPIWRDAYAAACLHVAKLDYASKDFESAMKALDMGMIMGGLDFREELEVCIGKVREALRERLERDDEKSLDEEGGMCFVVSGDFKLEEALKLLPTRSLACKRVSKKSGLSMERFLQEHFLTGSPVIISDAMNHWPAMERWNDMDYLKSIAGFRTVPVEVVGRKYIRLYPSSLSGELYPHSETMLSNSSQVDLDNVDGREFPKFGELEFWDCVLEEAFGGALMMIMTMLMMMIMMHHHHQMMPTPPNK